MTCDSQELCRDQSIESYPTLKYFNVETGRRCKATGPVQANSLGVSGQAMQAAPMLMLRAQARRMPRRCCKMLQVFLKPFRPAICSAKARDYESLRRVAERVMMRRPKMARSQQIGDYLCTAQVRSKHEAGQTGFLYARSIVEEPRTRQRGL